MQIHVTNSRDGEYFCRYKMILMFILFHSLLLLLAGVPSAQGRLAGKCQVHGKRNERFEDTCRGEKLLATCYKVTDITQDLKILPSNLLSLCILMEVHMPALVPLTARSLSRFVSLQYLYISGCFSQIHYGAFQGLTNLTELHLVSHHMDSSYGCCALAIESAHFSHLTALKSLTLSLYNLSTMALNVFEHIPQLEMLNINGCIEDWSEIVCHLTYLKMVHELILTAEYLEKLNHPNCSIWNISMMETTLRHKLSNSSLTFNKIGKIEQRALKYFGDLNYLRVTVKAATPILMYLALFGISKVNTLHINVLKVYLDELCILSEMYSVETININYDIIDTKTVTSKGCKGLKILSLQSSSYTVYPLDIHIILPVILQTNLSELYIYEQILDPTDVNMLCCSLTQPNECLSLLNLNGNNLKRIVSNQFVCFPNLETIDLSFCNISEIEDFAFGGLNKLKFLSLQHNIIVNIHKHTFSTLYSLVYLDLQNNLISYIETKSFEHLANLQKFLLGNLNYPPDEQIIELNISDIFGEIPRNLSYLFISSALRPMQLVIGSSSTLTQSLSLHIVGHGVTVEDCESSLMESVVALRINSGHALCGSEFIGKYTRHVENLEFKSVISDNVMNVEVINRLVHLKTLSLANIDLLQQANVAFMLHNLTKLETLALINCRIDVLDGSLSKDLKSLTEMYLTFRHSVTIFSNFAENLVQLKYLYIWNLHLLCSCSNVWLVPWAKNNKEVMVHAFNPPLEELECLGKNGTNHLNFVHYTKEVCSFEKEFVLFLSTSLSVITFVLAVLVQRFAGSYMLPLYHIIHGWFWEALRKGRHRRYCYDAFVSYSGKDEGWVVEQLLPNLERRGPPFLRLCLHSRDFQPGQDIIENITDSLYASRWTLCLVSRSYLKSSWCALELQLATCRLQLEHRDNLILVFLEKVPSQMLSTHHRLARLLKTRTYLTWPEDAELHDAFWHKIWDKLRPETGD